MIIIGSLLLVVTIISIYNEPRRFRNAVGLLFSFMFLLYGIMILNNTNASFVLIFNIAFVLTIPLALLFVIVFLFVDGIILIKKEGFSISNLLPFVFDAGIIFFISYLVLSSLNGYQEVNALYFMNLYFLFILMYIALSFISFFFYSFIYGLLPKYATSDFIIIHGAGLVQGNRIGKLFASRIDKAILLFHKGNDNAIIIASGGQGNDETISEAEAMEEYLISKNIPKQKIIREDKSTTTKENLIYSKKIMDEIKNDYKCFFVTSNYHVFRTGLFAREVGIENAEGVGARTALYYWPTAFIREYIAILVYYKWSFVVLSVLYIIFVYISFQ